MHENKSPVCQFKDEFFSTPGSDGKETGSRLASSPLGACTCNLFPSARPRSKRRRAAGSEAQVPPCSSCFSRPASLGPKLTATQDRFGFIDFDARRLSASLSRSSCLCASCLRASCLRASCSRSSCLCASCLRSSCLCASCLRSTRSDNAGCVHSLTVCMLLVLPSNTAIIQFFRGSRFSPK